MRCPGLNATGDSHTHPHPLPVNYPGCFDVGWLGRLYSGAIFFKKGNFGG